VRGSYIGYSVFQALYVFAVTASTGYAVLRHRIIDINVVLSRTLVYTLLSALVGGLFALVDLFFTKTLMEFSSASATSPKSTSGSSPNPCATPRTNALSRACSSTSRCAPSISTSAC
jgi:hypothetical protein